MYDYINIKKQFNFKNINITKDTHEVIYIYIDRYRYIHYQDTSPI